MTYDLTGAPPQPPLRGKGLLLTGVGLLLAGLLAVVIGIIGTATTAGGLISQIGSPETTPATITRQLDAGTTYAVYEQTSGGAGTTDDPFIGNVQPADIVITGPGGTTLPVEGTGSTVNTVGDGTQLFAEVATFAPTTSGSYTIDIGTQGSLVSVAPATSSVGKAVAWIGLIGLGVLLGLVGLVLLVVGAIQRSSSRRQRNAGAAGAYAAPAAGVGYAQQPPAAQGYPVQGYSAPGYPTEGYPTQGYPQAGPTEAYPAQGFATPAPGSVEADPFAPPAQPVQQQPVQPHAVPAPAPQALPPAGWYPDPDRPGGQRYWDGGAWTEHRA